MRTRPGVPVPDGAAGRRAVYEPQAHAFEKPSRDSRRISAQGADVRALLADHPARRDVAAPPGFLVELVSHRVLRYGSGILHLILLVTSLGLAPRGPTGIVLAGQLALLAAAAAGVPIARYYVLVTWATVVALWNYLRRGVPATWDKAEGTR